MMSQMEVTKMRERMIRETVEFLDRHLKQKTTPRHNCVCEPNGTRGGSASLTAHRRRGLTVVHDRAPRGTAFVIT